jgi:hypothetical protein
MKQLKTGDWVKLYPKSPSAKSRIEVNGNHWVIEELLPTQIRVRSSERTFGSKNSKRFDGMVIWLEHDPNYDWSL